MTFLYQILFNTIRSRDALREGLEAPKVDNAVLDTILKDFRFLYYRAGQFPADSGFWGRNTSISQMDRVDFLTSRTSRVAELEEATQASGSSPLVEVGYAGKRSEPNEPGGRWFSLYRREAYFPDDDPTDGGMFDLIYDKVRRFDLRYFAAAEERAKDDSGLEEWDSKVLHKVPAAIELDPRVRRPRAARNEPNPQGRVEAHHPAHARPAACPRDTGAMGMTRDGLRAGRRGPPGRGPGGRTRDSPGGNPGTPSDARHRASRLGRATGPGGSDAFVRAPYSPRAPARSSLVRSRRRPRPGRRRPDRAPPSRCGAVPASRTSCPRGPSRSRASRRSARSGAVRQDRARQDDRPTPR